MPDTPLTLNAVRGIPPVSQGDDIAELIVRSDGWSPVAGSALVISHKIVSKAEGATVQLADVTPGVEAIRIAGEQNRDPRHVQVILDQSRELLRAEHGVLICVTHHGFVCANAGVDRSNSGDPETVVVLPSDPDRSARSIRARIADLTGIAPAVVIADSFGRAWRIGQVDVAIGCAGLLPIDDWSGRTDRDGLELEATEPAVADLAAAAAELVRSKDSGEPVVAIAGLERFVGRGDGPGAAALLRPADEDLFRR